MLIISRTKADGRKLVKIVKKKKTYLIVGERKQVLREARLHLSKEDFMRLCLII